MASIYSWSTTAGSNATADGDINWSEGQLPSTVNDSARQMMARVAEWVADQGWIAASGTDTLTLTTNSAFTAYANGRAVVFKAANTNTGAVTLNVNSIGAKAIRKVTTTEEALVAGDIAANGIYIVRYDASANSAAGAWILVSPTLPTITAFAKTILDDADEATFKATVNLEIGTDVQAYDADLAAIAALTSAADKVPYATGSGTWALADFTASGRDLVAQAITTDQYVYGDGAASWAVGTITAAGRALLDDADATAQLATLGTGTMATQNANNVAITGGTIAITKLNVGAPESVTIASGAITVTQSNVVVAGEGGAADDLVTINGGTVGDMLFIRPGGSGTITVKNGTGNIWTGTDQTLDNIRDYVTLIYHTNGYWVRLASANNA